MARFRDRYLAAGEQHPLRILDIGSLDVNGSYRDLFAAPPWMYTGLDMAPGSVGIGAFRRLGARGMAFRSGARNGCKTA